MGEPAAQTQDPTVYRVEDDVGEHEIQTYILELLRPLIERYLRAQGTAAHVGPDQFIYWEQHDPQACAAPDIYVLPGVPQDIAIDVWKVWERKVVPSLVIEVVGRDPHKDYEQAPRRYAELGVSELIVTDADRVQCETLSCWLRHTGTDATTRLRLATGEDGETLYPTAEEAERAAKEAALQRIAELEAELKRR